jgi:hypothetical protein
MGDQRPWNDTALTAFYAGYVHDLSIGPIMNPITDSSSIPVVPRVMIGNIGINMESDFEVVCSISFGDSEIYSQAVIFPETLAPLETAQITFPDFMPLLSGHYIFDFHHTLSQDRNVANDSASIDIFLDITGMKDSQVLPERSREWQNYPNPFNSATVIIFDLPHAATVKVEVYDLLGKRIETLVHEDKPAGHSEVIWNATDVPSGVYFYKVMVGDDVITRKMMLLK